MKTIRILLLAVVVALCVSSAFGQTSNVDTVTFKWDPSPSPDVASYRLYFSKSTNLWTHVKEAGLSTQVTVGITEPGRWFFIATARTPAGLESLPSNMVVYDAPVAPLPADGLRVLSAIVTRISTIVTSTNLITVP